MTLDDISELHNISPIVNVKSILNFGILTHNQVKQIGHKSVAMPEIQKLRINKQIPGAGMLHDYVNLYFDAHNPISKCRCYNNDICVLRINKTVLALDGVIIADRNAAGSYVRFGPFPDGLDNIDKDRVFARFWLHADDIFDEWRHKSEKCAEVLVPGSVDSQYIVGAYVANPEARKQFQELNSSLTVQQKNDMFF